MLTIGKGGIFGETMADLPMINWEGVG